jgi:pyruvate/2-oxoglutarate/acetoin dehydrogenase E1 component
LLTVEEGGLTLGWGAEILARVAESSNDFPHGGASRSRYSLRRVAALDLPIANSKSLEDAILPSVEMVIHEALALHEA